MTRTYCCLHLSVTLLVILIHYFIMKIKANNEYQQHKSMSLKHFCETNTYNNTIEPEIQPIMCPKFFSSSIHTVVCPILFDLNITISYPLLSSLYGDP